MANPTNIFDQKENERRKAIGLPPLPRRGRKPLQDMTKQDIEEYLGEVRGASMSMFPGYTEAQRDQYVEKIKQKVLNEIASDSKQKRKKRPKATDSVVIVDDSGTSGVSVGQLQQTAGLVARPSDRMLTPERPAAGEDGTSLRQRISKFEQDVFRNAFPTLSMVIDRVDAKTKQESREKSTESLQVRRALDRTETMAQALNDLALQQNKSTELLAELLEAVKGLNQQPGGSGSPSINVRGRFGRRLGRALRRAAPYAAGAAAIAGGAYALSQLMESEDGETPQAGTGAQEQVTREEAERAGVIDRAGRMIPLPPELAALPMSNAIQSDATKQTLPKPANDAAAVDAVAVEKTPAGSYNADISQMAGSDLMMKAKTITFKGDEIEFAGQQNDAAALTTPTSMPAFGGMGGGMGGPSMPRSQGGDRVSAPPVSTGLGGLSQRYESGGRGSAAIGRDSTGGWSYGTYQIATQTGTMSRFLQHLQETAPNLYQTLQQAGGAAGAEQGTQEFQNAWRSLSQDQNFVNAQHNFISRTHYEPLANNLLRLGLNVDERSAALREVLWSTGVQHGGGTNVVARAIESIGRPASQISDEELIRAIYAERRTRFGSSTQGVQAAVQNRFTEEQSRALSMLQTERNGGTTGTQVAEASQENAMAERTPAAPTVVAAGGTTPAGVATPGAAVPTTVQNPNDPGPVEPDDAAERYARLFNMAA